MNALISEENISLEKSGKLN